MGLHNPNGALHLPMTGRTNRPTRMCNDLLEPSEPEFQYIHCTINTHIT